MTPISNIDEYFTERFFSDRFKYFHDSSPEERVSIIECGIHAYQNGTKFSLERSNEDIRQRLNETHIIEMDAHRDKIGSLEETIIKINNNNDDIAKETANKYLDSWKDEFLQKNYSDKMEVTVNYERGQERIKLLEERITQYISDLEKEKELKNTYMSQIFNKKNSSLKGQGGEMEVHGYLSKLYPSNEIYNCSKEDHRADYYIEFESGVRIMIESKDYQSNVPKKEIDKAHRDLDENSDYNGAILVSLRSGIATKGDLSIDYSEKDKPMVYLHNVSENPEVLKLAISLVYCIIKNKLNSDINIDVMKECSQLKKELGDIIQNKKEFKKSINNLTGIYNVLASGYEKRLEYFINKFSNKDEPVIDISKAESIIEFPIESILDKKYAGESLTILDDSLLETLGGGDLDINYIDQINNITVKLEGEILLLDDLYTQLAPLIKMDVFKEYVMDHFGDSYNDNTTDIVIRKRYKELKDLKNPPRQVKNFIYGYKLK